MPFRRWSREDKCLLTLFCPIQKLIEDAAQNKPDGRAVAASAAAASSQQSQAEKPFSCPLCSLKISARQQMDHLCTHFSERLSARLPRAAPFACPDCRFVGADRRRLVRHYGGFHRHAHAMLVERLREAGGDPAAAADLAAAVKQEPQERIPPPNPDFAIECQLCDSLPVYKNKSELCKHLSDSHFMERIVSELPPMPTSVEAEAAASSGEGLKAFKCNRPDCKYSSTTRHSLLTHVGVFHKVALKLYLDVVGPQSELPLDSDQRMAWDDSSRAQSSHGGGGGGRAAEAVLRRQQAAAAAAAATSETPCAICGAKFDRSALLHHLAETHFPDKIAGLPSEVSDLVYNYKRSIRSTQGDLGCPRLGWVDSG